MTWVRAKPKGSAASSGTPRGSVLAALAAAAFWAFFPAGADGQHFPPKVRSQLPDVELRLNGGWVLIEDSPLRSVFTDIHARGLSFAVSSSAPEVVRATLYYYLLDITRHNPILHLGPVSVGRSTVTVTATDPYGLSASQSFKVTVSAANDPNRPPAASGALPGVTLVADGTEVVDVSRSFVDPDDDPLTFAVSSSAPKVVTAVAAGARVTLTAVAAGAATVTVTATDPGGLSVSQSFTVTVSPANRPPVASGALPGVTLAVGGTEVVDVSQSFVDPDDDPLTFELTVWEDRNNAVAASVAGARVTLTGVRDGAAWVTVTAMDPGGLSVSQTFTVTVSSRPPTVWIALPGVTLGVDGTEVVDVSQSFVDPDDDPLTFAVSSSAPKVVTAVAAGARVTLTAVAAGAATVTVTATDPEGLSVSQSFAVTVSAANRPPAASVRLPGVTLGVDGTEVVDVSQSFVDPDDDPLTFAVSSSAPKVVTAVAAGARVTLTAVAAGAATVTVTATDPEGLSVLQSFTVTVSAANRPPAASGALPGVTLGVDGTEVVDVSRSFVDPDDDPLTFAVSSSAPKVVTAVAAGARVTLTAVAAGAATVTVTATDPGGLSASQSFTVTVSAANRPPAASGALPGVTLGVDGTEVVDVSRSFVDPDDDPLTFAVSSSAPKVVTAVAAGARVTLTAVAAGAATVTVTATDPGGLSVTQSFTATVSAGNRPPAASGALRYVRLAPGEVSEVDVSRAFVDPDGDALTFAVSSSAPEVLTAVAAGARVTLTAVRTGTATVTVTATDPEGLSAAQSFTATVRTALSDRGVLEALYAATGGANWTSGTNWRTDAPLGTWRGVTTDGAGRVTGLDLRFNGLSGVIPAALGDLTNLESLDLSTNDLRGAIPPALGSLTNLRQLDLANNGLSGAIPAALGDLTNLESLHLANNGLSGAIPPALGSLTNLRRLGLSENGLNGAIPAALGDLTNLESLDLRENGLSGAIPPALGNLTSLEILFLDHNGLSGAIPPALGNLTSLEFLVLDGGNGLSGAIPVTLGNLTNLEWLVLSENGLSGAIPVTLGNLTSLEILHLDGNDLSGAIPVTLGNLTGLEELTLSHNGLIGPIPDAFGNMPYLSYLALDGNTDLSGPLPPGLRSAELLYFLDISNTGACAPRAWQDWLTRVHLSGQRVHFSGRMCGDGSNRPPAAAVALPPARLTPGEVSVVDVSQSFVDPDGDALTWAVSSSAPKVLTAVAADARVTLTAVAAGTATVTVTATDPGGLSVAQSFTATVRTALSDRAVLEALYAATGGANWTNGANWLTDAPLGAWRGVTTDGAGRVAGLDLDDNGLSGSIPDVLGDLTNLQRLNLGGNGLSGSIPDALGSLTNLRRLNLGANGLSGPVPDALGSLTNLEYLSIFNNGLSGAVPDALGGLANLEYLNLGANGLSGAVPDALGGLTNLEYLYLENNGLSGPIPDALGSLTSLAVASLGDNDLSGPIPAALGSLANLRRLHLGGNGLSGPIPAALGSLANLEHLHLRGNGLSGPIPAVLGSLTNLAWLYLGGNTDLSGPLPSGLRSVGSLRRLDVSGTRACAPGAWRDWLATLDFSGRLCDDVVSSQPPTVVGALTNVGVTSGSVAVVDVSQTFADPDGDTLSLVASSSAPEVLTVAVSGSRVTVTAVGAGAATVTVTATDPRGLSVAQAFTVTVSDRPVGAFADDPIRPGVTPIRAVHFTELRTRIDALRQAADLELFPWTDPVLTAGVTRVRLVHLLDLREALGAAYAAAGRTPPGWTDAAAAGRSMPIRAAHLMELRAAVTALE